MKLPILAGILARIGATCVARHGGVEWGSRSFRASRSQIYGQGAQSATEVVCQEGRLGSMCRALGAVPLVRLPPVRLGRCRPRVHTHLPGLAAFGRFFPISAIWFTDLGHWFIQHCQTLAKLGQTQSNLAQLGQTLANSASSGRAWPDVGQFWLKSVKCRPDCAELVPNLASRCNDSAALDNFRVTWLATPGLARLAGSNFRGALRDYFDNVGVIEFSMP